MSADGTVTSSDVRISDAAGNANHAAVTYGDLEHGIAWHDSRDGNLEVYFARTDPSGIEIGQEHRVSNGSGDSLDPAIAFSGSSWGLAYTDARDGNDEIYLSRLSQGAVALGPEQRLTDDGASSSHPTMAWDGSSFVIAWQDDRDGTAAIYFVMVDAEGVARGSAVRIAGSTGPAERPSIAWSGEAWAVAWQDTREATSAIYVATCRP